MLEELPRENIKVEDIDKEGNPSVIYVRSVLPMLKQGKFNRCCRDGISGN